MAVGLRYAVAEDSLVPVRTLYPSPDLGLGLFVHFVLENKVLELERKK